MVSEQEAQLGFMQREVTRAQHDPAASCIWPIVSTSRSTHQSDVAKVDGALQAAAHSLPAMQPQTPRRAFTSPVKSQKSTAKRASAASTPPLHVAQPGTQRRSSKSPQQPSARELDDAEVAVCEAQPAGSSAQADADVPQSSESMAQALVQHSHKHPQLSASAPLRQAEEKLGSVNVHFDVVHHPHLANASRLMACT
ncbi:hypothetical protein WJX84_000571 [Apatococcus fuscideae]|uniref:Uncharacterized protein n=1 Tax=Apatococcus fuscideae TaxID=2026836 RepID=A0AAW1STX5_9CHLO